ncbi:PDK repeat-containing protein [Thermoplasmatales archaeon SCGC AB-540-F20]|nr:PDK repeat-containing protein [Thermoplasmatales archaeon SCGC AB-540-F20]
MTADAGDTTVSLSPSSQTVSSEDTFNVNVSCVPGQPIRAFEFRLSFNPSLLQVNSVTEGNIFSEYNTYFNSGTIDNNAGTIADVYNLIIGSGNVSDSGTFVTISFTATKDSSGTSSLDINDVGVTDETGYVSIEVSDGSITVQGTNLPSPPVSPSGGGTEQNNPPDVPVKPSGPTFVELGVEYQYTSSAVDPDGDDIRYRFDWGDGNMSNWTAFVPSNTSVSLNYSWASISTFAVYVLAQDENGLNSSWSLPLNVTVSAIDFEGELPVADFVVPSNLTANQTIIFDGSGSFDEDGVIVSYNWDFGDGNIGNGITSSHVYERPGEYTVTLVVTDNNGNTYSKSILAMVGSEVEVREEQSEEDQGALPFDLGTFLVGSAIVLIICLVVFFRDDIKSFALSHVHYLHLPSHWKIWDTSYRIKRIDAKIGKLQRMRVGMMECKQSPVVETNIRSHELPNGYFKARRYIDFMCKSSSNVKKSFDESDNAYSGEKIDKLSRKEFECDKRPAETKDGETPTDLSFRSTIDTLRASDIRKNPNKIDIEKESMSPDSDKTDVEKKIDNFLISKMRERIDDL